MESAGVPPGRDCPNLTTFSAWAVGKDGKSFALFQNSRFGRSATMAGMIGSPHEAQRKIGFDMDSPNLIFGFSAFA